MPFAHFCPFPSLPKSLEELEKQLVSQSFQQLKSSHKVADEHLLISQSKASRLIRKYCVVVESQGIMK